MNNLITYTFYLTVSVTKNIVFILEGRGGGRNLEDF